MPEIFTNPFTNGLSANPWHVLARLVVALLLGALVAWIHVRTTRNHEAGTSFPTTLALLSVLIAMVTQVIGDNVARAFSLVGALSIVRFRTVVRDTRDTAYVIFAVVVGMAVGAQNLWAATMGIAVVGLAAFVMAGRDRNLSHTGSAENPSQLTVRMGLGQDLEKVAARSLEAHLAEITLKSVSTVRQGASLEFIYAARLRPGGSAIELVQALNRLEGVQDVQWRDGEHD